MSSPDISILFKNMDINDFDYREIRQEESTHEAEERWPLLKLIHLKDVPGGENPRPELADPPSARNMTGKEEREDNKVLRQGSVLPADEILRASPFARKPVEEGFLRKLAGRDAGNAEYLSHSPRTLGNTTEKEGISRKSEEPDQDRHGDRSAVSNQGPKLRFTHEAVARPEWKGEMESDLRVVFQRLCGKSENPRPNTAPGESRSLAELFKKLAKVPRR